MQSNFIESTALVCERVDRDAGTIRGAKLCGLRSANGRRYTEAALRDARSLYEGAAMFVNHPGSPGAARDYQDRIGHVCNVAFRPQHGLYGDLSVNMGHPFAAAVLWDAEQNTRGVGLSHNVLAESRRDGDETVIESIASVVSVDVVAGPATTKSLFEQSAASLLESNAGNPFLELGIMSKVVTKQSKNPYLNAATSTRSRDDLRTLGMEAAAIHRSSLLEDALSPQCDAEAELVNLETLRGKVRSSTEFTPAERDEILKALNGGKAETEQHIASAAEFRRLARV